MAEDIDCRIGYTFTGNWWMPTSTITFCLADGEYTVEFDPKVDTRDSLVRKLKDSIANGTSDSDHITLDDMTELELISESKRDIVRSVREKLAERMKVRAEQKKATPPRYDDEFYRGVEWLNTL